MGAGSVNISGMGEMMEFFSYSRDRCACINSGIVMYEICEKSKPTYLITRRIVHTGDFSQSHDMEVIFTPSLGNNLIVRTGTSKIPQEAVTNNH